MTLLRGAGHAKCHPTRQAVLNSTLCRECFQISQTVVHSDPRPHLVVGLSSHAHLELPLACPNCHTRPPGWSVAEDGAEARCMICGDDAYLAVR